MEILFEPDFIAPFHGDLLRTVSQDFFRRFLNEVK